MLNVRSGLLAGFAAAVLPRRPAAAVEAQKHQACPLHCAWLGTLDVAFCRLPCFPTLGLHPTVEANTGFDLNTVPVHRRPAVRIKTAVRPGGNNELSRMPRGHRALAYRLELGASIQELESVRRLSGDLYGFFGRHGHSSRPEGLRGLGLAVEPGTVNRQW